MSEQDHAGAAAPGAVTEFSERTYAIADELFELVASRRPMAWYPFRAKKIIERHLNEAIDAAVAERTAALAGEVARKNAALQSFLALQPMYADRTVYKFDGDDIFRLVQQFQAALGAPGDGGGEGG